MLIPAAAFPSDASASDSSAPTDETDSGWLAQTNLNGVPAGIPAPHSPAPVPGLTHVDWPFGTTFQPLAFSSDTALAGLYGYAGLVAFGGAYGDVGANGIGP